MQGSVRNVEARALMAKCALEIGAMGSSGGATHFFAGG